MGLASTDRGQTAIDYAIGIGLFLLAVAIVFALLPGLNRPVEGGTIDRQIADRVADRLTADVITRPHDPAALNATCTERFYNGTGGGNCPYGRPAAGNLSYVLGVNDTVQVNTTIERNGTRSTLNTTGDPTRLGIGPEPPTSGVPVTVTQRRVLLNGTTHRLIVRVW